MNSYDQYINTNNFWYPKIPINWKVCKVKHIAETIAGGTPSTQINEYWEDGDIPWLPSGKLQNCEITTAEKFISELGFNNSSTKWINSNTVLVALTGATCANIGYLTFRSCANQSVIAINENKNLANSRFLFYMFLEMRSQILTHQTGGAQAGINDSNVKNLFLMLPPIQEQSQIVSYLDHQTSLIDEIISRKEKQIELLKEKRQAIINEAVTKGLDHNVKMIDSGIDWMGEIPEHWVKARIGRYVKIVRGASPRPAGDPKFFGGNFIPWITVGEVTNGDSKFLFETTNYLTEEGSKQSRIILPETLLLSNSGATLGVPKISMIKGCINDGSVAFLDFNPKLNRDYLFYFFTSHTEIYRKEMSGYGQPNLNTDIIKSTSIPLPPINEQKCIIDSIENKLSSFGRLNQSLSIQVEKLKEYRQSIISEAVTGKIDVRDWRPNLN